MFVVVFVVVPQILVSAAQAPSSAVRVVEEGQAGFDAPVDKQQVSKQIKKQINKQVNHSIINIKAKAPKMIKLLTVNLKVCRLPSVDIASSALVTLPPLRL